MPLARRVGAIVLALAAIAEQQNESVGDERLPALAVLVVLGLALHIATSTRPADPDGAASGPVVPAADPGPEPSAPSWSPQTFLRERRRSRAPRSRFRLTVSAAHCARATMGQRAGPP